MTEQTVDQTDLANGKRVAEELLYLVLKQIGEPVELSSDTLAAGREGDSMIDLTHDTVRDVWILRVVDIPNGEN